MGVDMTRAAEGKTVKLPLRGPVENTAPGSEFSLPGGFFAVSNQT